jgi:hypothetical protein
VAVTDRGWWVASALGALVLVLLGVWIVMRPSSDVSDVLALGSGLLGGVGLLLARFGTSSASSSPPPGAP